jgi:hypothetical protein
LPYLNLLDFFLWGHLESAVCATAVNNVADLQQQIADDCQDIQNTPKMFQQVRQSLLLCAMLCVEVKGKHFEYLL